ncbi:hypothetical protein LXL04_036921 [Taraxacum kok-saghyz]
MVVQIVVMMCEIVGTVFEIEGTVFEIEGAVFDTVVVVTDTDTGVLDTVVWDTVVVDTDTDNVVVFDTMLETPAVVHYPSCCGVLSSFCCEEELDPLRFDEPLLLVLLICKSRIHHRCGPAVGVCRWQTLPLLQPIPAVTPAVNLSTWQAADRLPTIPCSLTSFDSRCKEEKEGIMDSRYEEEKGLKSIFLCLLSIAYVKKKKGKQDDWMQFVISALSDLDIDIFEYALIVELN